VSAILARGRKYSLFNYYFLRNTRDKQLFVLYSVIKSYLIVRNYVALEKWCHMTLVKRNMIWHSKAPTVHVEQVPAVKVMVVLPSCCVSFSILIILLICLYCMHYLCVRKVFAEFQKNGEAKNS
jgi:hypothetical protein